jgi:hypothetical protein
MFGCSWFEAFQICKQSGGFLVEINDQQKWDLMSSQLHLISTMTHTDNFHWWTGAHFNSAYYRFHWFQSGYGLNFFDWDYYEPSQQRDSAIFLAKEKDGENFRWFSAPADRRHGHPICQK